MAGQSPGHPDSPAISTVPTTTPVAGIDARSRYQEHGSCIWNGAAKGDRPRERVFIRFRPPCQGGIAVILESQAPATVATVASSTFTPGPIVDEMAMR